MKLRARFVIRMLLKFGMPVLRRRKKQLIKLINDKVDLPAMNEKQEEALLEALFSALIDVLENL